MSKLAPHLPRQLKSQGDQVLDMMLRPTSVLSPRTQTAIYDLWAQNIGPLVKGTSMHDDELTKREEMFDPTMRYILLGKSPQPPSDPQAAKPATITAEDTVRPDETQQSIKKKKKPEKLDIGQEELVGYCSFRFDMEQTLDDEREADVAYCYELQLSSDGRGTGLGVALMQELETIGLNIGLEKVMLTCMKSNKTALRFYHRNGYTPDEIDPIRMLGPRDVEDDNWVEAEATEIDYRILSKSLV